MTMYSRLLNVTAVLAALLFAALPVHGQFGIPGGGSSSQPPQRVTVELAVHEGVVEPGTTATLGVVMDIQTKWKIQAGEGTGDDASYPSVVEVTLPDGWQAGNVLWPEAATFELVMEGYREEVQGYGGRVLVAVPIDVPVDAQPGEHDVEVAVTYQACDDKTCDMPTTVTKRGTISVVADRETAEVPELDASIAELFAATIAHNPADEATGDEDKNAADDADKAAASADAAATPRSGSEFLGMSVPQAEGVLGVLLLALLSAIGGFILNLTPCVLPVIPIKIMTLQQHANKPGETLMLGLWMFAGVVVFWLAIGLPVAFLTGVTDPSQIFGIWWVTFGIGAIIAIMGIGIMGMFSIQLPQSVYAINPKADTPWGSFVFGVMTAVLGLPCFGFVAGALLVGSAQMPPVTIMTIFTSLGVGMGLPYLVLAAKPSLVERIPRTGPASELVKQVMGLLLIAAAAYFIGSGLIALVETHSYMGRQLHWWAVALFAAVACGWLIIRTFQITPRTAPRAAFLLIGLVIGGFAVVYAAVSTAEARSDWIAKQNAEASPRGYLTGIWNDYSPATFANAREDGKIVVLDFTAEWCLICKGLKAGVLNRDPVRSELDSDAVVKFTVDLTSRTAEGWDFLEELGQTGIPLLVIYTPGSDEPWQSNSYTSQQVLTAIDAARNGQDARLARN